MLREVTVSVCLSQRVAVGDPRNSVARPARAPYLGRQTGDGPRGGDAVWQARCSTGSDRVRVLISGARLAPRLTGAPWAPPGRGAHIVCFRISRSVRSRRPRLGRHLGRHPGHRRSAPGFGRRRPGGPGRPRGVHGARHRRARPGHHPARDDRGRRRLGPGPASTPSSGHCPGGRPSSAARSGPKPQAQTLAANVDTVLVLVAADGRVTPRSIERYVTLVWESGATPVVVLTKADLVSADELDDAIERLEPACVGVDLLAISAPTGTGLDAVARYFGRGRTVALLGSSGAGKSTLANHLSGAALATGAVREGDHRGRHTTTHRELVPLPDGGVLIDSPGLREVGLWHAEKEWPVPSPRSRPCSTSVASPTARTGRSRAARVDGGGGRRAGSARSAWPAGASSAGSSTGWRPATTPPCASSCAPSNGGVPGVRPGPQAMEEADERPPRPSRRRRLRTMRQVLDATGLVKRYKRTTAVDGVSLTVDAGERVALLGANGAGKTTTLLMLLGAITPDEGTVDGARPPPAGRAQRGHGGRRLRRRLPAAARPPAGAGGPGRTSPTSTAWPTRRRPSTPASSGFRIAHLADAMASELSSGQRTLVGHRQGHAAPAPAARARRADRLARPRRRPPGARRARADLRRGRLGAARDLPQHDRRRTHLRAGGLPLPRPGGGRRRRRPRWPASSAGPTSRRSSSTSPSEETI